MSKNRKKRNRRRRPRRLTPDEEVAEREVAFAAIRRLYAESLPLWRFCRSGHCRRHKLCGSGDVRPCLSRTWPLVSEKLQDEAYRQVIAGGPATHMEWQLREFPPTNFVR